MASSFSTLPLCTTKTRSSSFSNSSFYTKPSYRFLHGKLGINQLLKVSCMGGHEANLDRRNVLLGLGGLYGAANLSPLASSAEELSGPIPAPNLKKCGTALIKAEGPDVPYSCCPPIPDDADDIPYYELPPVSNLRMRQAAHTVDEEYIAKYQQAISAMKALDIYDPSNPIGFKQQANIHCAYCNNAYTVGGKKLQVHESWLFFPFHRWYLYFYERILGSLINDPTFALPYWNWDNPIGMRLPPMYDDKCSSLYDARRNPNIRNGTIMDLGYFPSNDKVETSQQQTIANNLTLMYRQMITNAPCPLDFFGKRYTLETGPPGPTGPGTIENIPHTPVHILTGTKPGRKSYGEDMGNFYSASLDPVFNCHHGNVDRMWNIWKTLGGKRRNLTDRDWLDAAFFFYDENGNPWRVKVQDCLNNKKMGYDYAPMPTPWRYYKPQAKSKKGKVDLSSIKAANDVFPLSKLDKTISFSIKRPATSRSQQDKDKQEEMLKFKGFKYDDREYIRFDVFLNADNTVNANELDKIEFAGCYSSLPHVHAHNASHEYVPREFKLAITELLEDNGLEYDDTIVVTVVPKKGGEVISIENVELELVDC